MARLADSVAGCSCGAQVLWDPDEPEPCCWNCANLLPPPPLLVLPARTVALSEGAIVTGEHLSGDLDFRTLRGLVERHQELPGEFVLRNVSDAAWTVSPVGEDPAIVAPGARVRVRPMTIGFGNVRGIVRTVEQPD
jgi:hypothetical protein